MGIKIFTKPNGVDILLEEMEKVTITGKCPAKSNSYRIIKRGGHSSLAKSKVLKNYENSFYLQLPPSQRGRNIQGFFEFYIDVYYPTKANDLDNCLKIVLDCLQKARVIKNDNNCLKIVANKVIDKINPRIEFIVKEL